MDNLILELIEVKMEKCTFARKQKYEDAARSRDVERKLEKKIYHIITSSDVDNNHLWLVYKETISNYIFEKYGQEYPDYWQDLDTGKSIMRELKLKILGI